MTGGFLRIECSTNCLGVTKQGLDELVWPKCVVQFFCNQSEWIQCTSEDSILIVAQIRLVRTTCDTGSDFSFVQLKKLIVAGSLTTVSTTGAATTRVWRRRESGLIRLIKHYLN